MLSFFAISWDAFLLFWYFGAPSGGGLFFMLFPIAHVAVGILLTYYVVCGFTNRTVIAASNGSLTVWHGPLPGGTNHTIERDELQQLFVTQTHNKRSSSFQLRALLHSGRELTLVSALDELGQAQHLEHAFEAHLGIEDRRIANEMPKPT